MLAQGRHLGTTVLPRAAAESRGREAAAVLAILLLAGLVWLIIGAAIMRGAVSAGAKPAPRARRSLQRGLADLQALSAG
jgi:hypothetical protein